MSKGRERILPLVPVIGGMLFLTACSGPTEDVRVKTCKQLATTLLETDADVEWQAPEQTLRGYEYAKIDLKGSGAGKIAISCFYEHDAEDETDETHVDPISAYSTVPYEVRLNGEVITATVLYKAINQLRLDAGKRLLEKAKVSADKAISKGAAVIGY